MTFEKQMKEGDEMQMRKAAPIAYTRRKYIGFPETLLVQPEDFSEKTAKKFLKYAIDAMDSSEALRSGRQYARAVIVEDGFVVLGIMTYLRNMVDDGWEGKDMENRPIYGFFGYVWHKEDFTARAGFPALEEFTPILNQWIRPHWEDKYGSEVPQGEYSFAVTLPDSPRPLQGYAPGRKFVEPDEADRLIQWAMEKACAGEAVSVCTCADIYYESDFKTQYQYAAKLRRTGGRESQPAETWNPLPEKQKERAVSFREQEEKAGEDMLKKAAIGEQKQAPDLAKWGLLCCVLAVVLCLMGGIIFHSFLPGVLLLLLGLGIMAASRKKPEKGQARPVTMEPERQKPPLQRPQQPPKTPQAGGREPAKKKESTEDIFKL